MKTFRTCRHHEISAQLGHAPGRPLIIGHYEGNLGDFHEGSSDKNGQLCGSDCPKTPCDPGGRGDEDRTGAKGQQWAYCLGLAWYGLTAREWYQAKTTDLIQSVFLSAAAGWWGGRIIIEALFQLAHPTPASISLNFTSGAVCPHTSKS